MMIYNLLKTWKWTFQNLCWISRKLIILRKILITIAHFYVFDKLFHVDLLYPKGPPPIINNISSLSVLTTWLVIDFLKREESILPSIDLVLSINDTIDRWKQPRSRSLTIYMHTCSFVCRRFMVAKIQITTSSFTFTNHYDYTTGNTLLRG